MAVFQYNNRTIPYQMELAPFTADLLLLQGSRFTTDYWRPVLEDLGSLAPAGGRVLTCEWADDAIQALEPQELVKFIETLGLQNLHIVASDDAVKLAAAAQKLAPEIFVKTLFFEQNAPKGEDLKRAVRVFCPLES